VESLTGDLQEGLQINHVGFIIEKESLEGVKISLTVLVPEHDSLIAAHLLNFILPTDAKKRLNGFETAPTTETSDHMEEIDVGLTETKIEKETGDEREVEAGAIKGNQ
jgi:hypothetical protein